MTGAVALTVANQYHMTLSLFIRAKACAPIRNVNRNIIMKAKAVRMTAEIGNANEQTIDFDNDIATQKSKKCVAANEIWWSGYREKGTLPIISTSGDIKQRHAVTT